MNSRACNSACKQQGLTLIELMITVLLSSFLLLGILQIFISSNSSDRVNSALARLQENGRIALDMLKHDLRRTGYQGCAVPSARSRANSIFTFPLDAVGEQDVDTLEGDDTASDTLVMRHASPGMLRASSISQTQLTIITDNNNMLTQAQRYSFILTNCEDVAIFSGLASARANNADPLTQVSMPNQYTISALQGLDGGAAPSLYGMPSGAGSQFLRIVENRYDIQNDPTNGNRPTLYKNNAAMIASVENFQVLYGVESGGQTRWFNASDLTDARRQQVSRLQISLVISSQDEVSDNINAQAFDIANIGADTQLPAIADRRLRRVFNSTIDLRNRP